MTREDYRSTLLNKGFTFDKTTLSYPSWRGEEDVYTYKPKYKYTFRVFRIHKDKPDYGFYVGVGDQFRELDAISEHNLVSTASNGKLLPMWTEEAFIQLMKSF